MGPGRARVDGLGIQNKLPRPIFSTMAWFDDGTVKTFWTITRTQARIRCMSFTVLEHAARRG